VIPVVIVALVPQCLHAEVVLDESGEFTADSQSETTQLTVEVHDTDKILVLDTKVVLTEGKANVRVVAPDGKTITDHGTSGSMSIGDQLIKTDGRTGIFEVHIVPEKALGTWTVRVSVRDASSPSSSQWAAYLAPGVVMTLVGIIAVLAWRWRSGANWRWFWAGAAVWTVGVALKFAWAIPLNAPILAAIEAVVPHDLYLVLGGIYIGLLTGVFEIGITLLAAIFWKKMSQDATRGVAVGVGAGAFEAILLGIVATSAVVLALAFGGEFRERVIQAIARNAGSTSLIWLVGPVERVIVILCHVSSRALVLLGVARGRWRWPFLWGFLILTAIDSVAGYAFLAGMLGDISTWWIELTIAPAALVSVPAIVWCVRSWPEPPPSEQDQTVGAPAESPQPA
jgi:uncharacterized membrane protein YhfC